MHIYVWNIIWPKAHMLSGIEKSHALQLFLLSAEKSPTHFPVASWQAYK